VVLAADMVPGWVLALGMAAVVLEASIRLAAMSAELRRLQAAVSERDFQDAVIEYARLHGWRCHHSRPAQMKGGRWVTPIQGHPGYPDLTLARKGKLIFLELKTTSGRTTAGQEGWLKELATVPGVEVRVLCPADWPLIEEMLG